MIDELVQKVEKSAIQLARNIAAQARGMVTDGHGAVAQEGKRLDSRELESNEACLMLVLVLILIRSTSTLSWARLVVQRLCMPGVG